MSKKGWTSISKLLVNAGQVAFFGCAIAMFALTEYANFARPHVPDPSKTWIVRIPWSNGAYGTPRERQRVNWCFNSGFYFFGLIAAGEAIRIYKLREYP
jgi:hypothetical protein